MTNERQSDRPRLDRPSSLTDPLSLCDCPDVAFGEETIVHDDPEHSAVDIAGRAVVGVTNDAGELLLLVNPELSVALLPHGTVNRGEDWTTVACDGVEGQTGISVELDGIEAVREVAHVLEDDGDDGRTTTHRVVFSGSPVGGEIQPCKRSTDAGSDAWTADWFEGSPAAATAPEGGSGDDLRLFLERPTVENARSSEQP